MPFPGSVTPSLDQLGVCEEIGNIAGAVMPHLFLPYAAEVIHPPLTQEALSKVYNVAEGTISSRKTRGDIIAAMINAPPNAVYEVWEQGNYSPSDKICNVHTLIEPISFVWFCRGQEFEGAVEDQLAVCESILERARIHIQSVWAEGGKVSASHIESPDSWVQLDQAKVDEGLVVRDVSDAARGISWCDELF